MDYLILVPVSYLIGSVPFGLMATKLVARVDVRNFGSGRIGMTNVMRIAGKPTALCVLLLDMGKGVVAVILARLFFDSPGVEVAAALAVIFGHNWPVFIGFRGGRGTASGWGALIILSPIAGVIATVVGFPLLAITRYVSLGSVSAATLGSIAIVVLALMGEAPLEYSLFGAIGGTVIVLRHLDNIKRLLNGTERKIGQSVDLASGH